MAIVKPSASQRLKLDTLCEITNLARRRGIVVTILSGYNIESHNVGRDVDVLVNSEPDARTLLTLTNQVLHKRNFRYIIIPNPIWGYRCIGISNELDYFELHIVWNFKVASVPVRIQYPIETQSDHLGVSFDPKYIFFKTLLVKYNRAILAKKELPLTARNQASLLLRNWHIKDQDRLLEELAVAISEPGNVIVLKRRQQLLVAFLLTALRHPIHAFILTAQNIFKNKAKYIFEPCAPLYYLSSSQPQDTVDIEEIRQKLAAELSHIFPKVLLIAPSYANWLPSLASRARQHLVILTRPPKWYPGLPKAVKLDPGQINQTSPSHADSYDLILGGFHIFNRKWHTLLQVNEHSDKFGTNQ